MMPAFAWPKLRRHALALFAVVSVLWTAWGLDVYLFEAAPHWGQRETIMTYYATRKGPNEPFIAYQMNWKGENFYMGNRVPAFVTAGTKFKNWIADEKKKGVTVTAEVAQQIGEGRVRCICLKPTDGLRRGTPVRNTGRSPCTCS